MIERQVRLAHTGDAIVFTQLIYTSSAAQDFSDEDLVEILTNAVRNNHQRNVTGLLLYTKGTFMQVIEGDSAVIDELIKTIKEDRRHHSIELHVRTPVREREFSQWHMGFRALKPADAIALPNYAPFFEDGFDTAMLAEKPGECIAIMKALGGLPE